MIILYIISCILCAVEGWLCCSEFQKFKKSKVTVSGTNELFELEEGTYYLYNAEGKKVNLTIDVKRKTA